MQGQPVTRVCTSNDNLQRMQLQEPSSQSFNNQTKKTHYYLRNRKPHSEAQIADEVLAWWLRLRN